MSEFTNELVSASKLDREISGMQSGNMDMYSSIKGDDFETKIATVEATTNSLPAADNLGKVIQLKNVIVQKAELADEDTGELTEQPRVILIAEDGTSYHAISTGLLTSLKNLFGMAGEPHQWPKPVSCMVVEGKSRKGYKFMTLKIVRPTK